MAAKKGTISQGCKACGFHGPLEVQHKVNTFIIKNPPTLNPAVQGSSLTEGKRSKRSKKGAENGGDSANTTAAEGDISAADADIQVPKVVDEEEVTHSSFYCTPTLKCSHEFSIVSGR